MKAFLLSGVHGVGKGYFIERIKSILNGYEIYSASSMIEKYKHSTDAGYKKVKNVKRNQEILIKAIKSERKNTNKNFILDGHLCLFNADGEPERIQEEFFKESGITGIILLQDNIDTIYHRLQIRDNKPIDKQNLGKMQTEEYKYASELKEKYDICIYKITPQISAEKFAELLDGGEICE